MKITPTRTHMPDRIERTASVEDGEDVVISNRFAHKGKTLRVDRVLAIYRPINGEWYCSSIQVMGHLLKSDGTPGKVYTEDEFSVPTASSSPEWVRKIAAHLLPAGPAPTHVTDALLITA